MPGIKQWSKNVEVQANPAKRMRYIDASFSTLIVGGGSQIISLYAPIGYITRVKIARFRYDPFVAANPSTGNVSVSIGVNNGALLATASQPFNGSILDYAYGAWGGGGTSTPNDLTAQFLFPQQMVYDQTSPIEITFTNGTNVGDLGRTKYIFLWAEDEKITS